ncbi:hypothetical protein RND81_08G163700 [Saponaria officinalis]|uniref:Uncharacterized protein n=1 Tax=Saponaria officinalis TaxID=3572 RepID=A0AAW1J7F5_SAPOF
MTRVGTTRGQIIIRPVGSSLYRRQHYIDSSPSCAQGRIAEVAGGTAAECVAVWCCCPCTLVNLVVLAVYKLPAGICRKALRKRRRRRMMKKGLLPLPSSASSSRHSSCQCSWDPDEFHMQLASVPEGQEVAVVVVGDKEMDNDLMELEKEMWSKFYNTGFWRSPSQREQ